MLSLWRSSVCKCAPFLLFVCSSFLPLFLIGLHWKAVNLAFFFFYASKNCSCLGERSGRKNLHACCCIVLLQLMHPKLRTRNFSAIRVQSDAVNETLRRCDSCGNNECSRDIGPVHQRSLGSRTFSTCWETADVD
jgi:hypothetical protein